MQTGEVLRGLAKHDADNSGESPAANSSDHHHEEQIGTCDFYFHGSFLWGGTQAGIIAE